MRTAKATFAAGCFWGVEESFSQIEGVVSTQVGYAGGHVRDPTYRDVCTGRTGHTESVEVEFDTDRTSYRALLEHFFSIHDPTTLYRQGVDVGSQYRSAIFYHDEAQRLEAERVMREVQGRSARKVVTQIAMAGPFYRAEEYHQRYIAKGGRSLCHL
jgi:peptide-methionine (S)-S-oxide reductase